MKSSIFYFTILLTLQAASSYVLFTANMDDFHNLAKQIAASPIGAKLNQIIRRASTIFNEQLKEEEGKAQLRSMQLPSNSDELWKPDSNVIDQMRQGQSDVERLTDNDEKYVEQKDEEKVVERRTGHEIFGKNASYYLQSIKKIFDDA